jgi:hypothetical protein
VLYLTSLEFSDSSFLCSFKIGFNIMPQYTRRSLSWYISARFPDQGFTWISCLFLACYVFCLCSNFSLEYRNFRHFTKIAAIPCESPHFAFFLSLLFVYIVTYAHRRCLLRIKRVSETSSVNSTLTPRRNPKAKKTVFYSRWKSKMKTNEDQLMYFQCPGCSILRGVEITQFIT